MWTVHLPQRVDKELAGVPPHLREPIAKALEDLPHDPHPVGCKKLKGQLRCWRVRVGSYRILYDVLEREHVILILKIGPRKDVYR